MTPPEESRSSGEHPEMVGDYQASQTMPQNVAELLTRAQLDNARDVFRLIESRSELNAYQDRELAVKIVRKLADYHSDVINKSIEEGNAAAAATWAADLARLQQAIQLLEAVDLSDD
jgi:hypothetical protein